MEYGLEAALSVWEFLENGLIWTWCWLLLFAPFHNLNGRGQEQQKRWFNFKDLIVRRIPTVFEISRKRSWVSRNCWQIISTLSIVTALMQAWLATYTFALPLILSLLILQWCGVLLSSELELIFEKLSSLVLNSAPCMCDQKQQVLFHYYTINIKCQSWIHTGTHKINLLRIPPSTLNTTLPGPPPLLLLLLLPFPLPSWIRPRPFRSHISIHLFPCGQCTCIAFLDNSLLV